MRPERSIEVRVDPSRRRAVRRRTDSRRSSSLEYSMGETGDRSAWRRLDDACSSDATSTTIERTSLVSKHREGPSFRLVIRLDEAHLAVLLFSPRSSLDRTTEFVRSSTRSWSNQRTGSIHGEIPPEHTIDDPMIHTLTDVFRLDTIHRDLLPKLTSHPPQQPLFVFADQNFNGSLHNTFVVQITLSQPLANETFSFDILYQSDSSNAQRSQELTGSYFTEELARLQNDFDQRFENTFQLKARQNMTDKQIHFARSTLSNLLGGIAYFTGQSLVANANQSMPDLYWPTSLYTAVPSRSFFPRGLSLGRWFPQSSHRPLESNDHHRYPLPLARHAQQPRVDSTVSRRETRTHQPYPSLGNHSGRRSTSACAFRIHRSTNPQREPTDVLSHDRLLAQASFASPPFHMAVRSASRAMVPMVRSYATWLAAILVSLAWPQCFVDLRTQS